MTDDMRRLAMGWLRRADGVTVIGDQPITDPVHVTVIIATPRPSVHDETGGSETTMYFLGTTDEIKIEGEEDGFMLAIYTDDGRTHHYRIGLPDQFRAEVERTIGRWLAEGEAARVTMPASLAEDDFDEAGFDMSDIYDPDLARDIERGK